MANKLSNFFPKFLTFELKSFLTISFQTGEQALTFRPLRKVNKVAGAARADTIKWEKCIRTKYMFTNACQLFVCACNKFCELLRPAVHWSVNKSAIPFCPSDRNCPAALVLLGSNLINVYSVVVSIHRLCFLLLLPSLSVHFDFFSKSLNSLHVAYSSIHQETDRMASCFLKTGW